MADIVLVKPALTSEETPEIVFGPVNAEVMPAPTNDGNIWLPVEDTFGPSIVHKRQEWVFDRFEILEDRVLRYLVSQDVDINIRREKMIADAKNWRKAKEVSGFYYDGNWYDVDLPARLSVMAAQWVDGFVWKARNTTFVPMTSEEFEEFRTKINEYTNALYAREHEFFTTISEGDHDVLDGVDLEDWPDNFYPAAPEQDS